MLLLKFLSHVEGSLPGNLVVWLFALLPHSKNVLCLNLCGAFILGYDVVNLVKGYLSLTNLSLSATPGGSQ